MTNEGCQKPRIALCLSGGGFRASLFHLGLLRRLSELDWLRRVDVLSTVSGGTIVGAFVALKWNSWLAAGGTSTAFDEIVIEPFLKVVCEKNFLVQWLAGSVAWPFRKLVNRGFTRTVPAADLFDDWFFDGALCTDLPVTPLLVINATSLQSIRAWRFTRDGLGDSRIGYSDWNSNPLSLGLAVCASASFPPVFPPVRIKRSRFQFSNPSYGDTPLPSLPYIPLTDGGVYDNAGMEAVIKDTPLPGQQLRAADFLIVSDGGAPAKFHFRDSGLPGLTEGLLLYRADQIAREQVTALRTRWFMDQVLSKRRQGILVSLKSTPSRIPAAEYEQYCRHVPVTAQIPPELLILIRGIRTSLDRFNEFEAKALMYHAYQMTDCFLWCYRSTYGLEYQVPEIPEPKWLIEFDEATIKDWHSALLDSGSTFRWR